jgi:hypothetical protein
MNSTGGTWQHARMTCRLSPRVSPSQICAASGRPAVPARGSARRWTPAPPRRLAHAPGTSTCWLSARRHLSPPRHAPGAVRLSWRAGRRAPALRAPGLTPGMSEGRRSPASSRSRKRTMIVLTTRSANSTAQVGAHADDTAAMHSPPAIIPGTCCRICPYLIKAAALRAAARRCPPPGSALAGPPGGRAFWLRSRVNQAPHLHRFEPGSPAAFLTWRLSQSPLPAQGRASRVATRSAFAGPGPGSCSQGLGSYEERGKK